MKKTMPRSAEANMPHRGLAKHGSKRAGGEGRKQDVHGYSKKGDSDHDADDRGKMGC